MSKQHKDELLNLSLKEILGSCKDSRKEAVRILIDTIEEYKSHDPSSYKVFDVVKKDNYRTILGSGANRVLRSGKNE